MPEDFDLVVRGGLIYDGSGGNSFAADVGLSNGRIAEIGNLHGRGADEIDARGKIVVPGFVDIHTHYDGQVVWESRTSPSANHGVTTALMGNCGVGFAPCRAADHDVLIQLMEGVEDIPEVVMRGGLPWSWQTFPEYLDAVERRPRDIDVAAQLPHSALRVYVMGERGARGETATEDDLQQMTALATEAMRAGALGFGTSRSIFHRSSDGRNIPSKDVGEAELHAIATGIAAAGHGVLQALFDPENLENDFPMLRRVAERSGLPLSFSLVQMGAHPRRWARTLELVEEANRDGVQIAGQIIGRPTGILLGLNLSYNPFSFYPSYAQIAALPLQEKIERLRDPQMRSRLLSEAPRASNLPILSALSAFQKMFPLEEPLFYEPSPNESIASLAQERGLRPEEVAYDYLLRDSGNAVLFVAMANFADGDFGAVEAMLKHPNTLLGLGDGGAHYGLLCDAGFTTYMLTYWTRDRVKGDKLPLEKVVRSLTRDNALAVGLADRGLLSPGYKADLNIIDYENLRLHAPRVAFDLPGGGRRLTQAASGYAATIVSGVVIQRDGVPTQELPGRLVRGPKAAHAPGR